MLKELDIDGFFKKIPGSSLLVPMIIFAVINTLFPELFSSLGGMSAATFKTGAMTIAGVIMFCTGAGLRLGSLGKIVQRCSALTIMKFVSSVVLGFAYMYFFGTDGLWGVNAVAFIACICSCNPGIFMGLADTYGEPEDIGNFVAMNVMIMPCFPVLILTLSSGGGFDYMSIISVLVPFALGIIVGNLDTHYGDMLAPLSMLMLPFLGACFGSLIDLKAAAQAGLAGVILSLMYLLICIPLMLFTDKAINRRQGYCGVGWCSVAGIAMTVPALVSGNPVFAPFTEAAIAQIAMCLIVTDLLNPYIAKLAVNIWGSPQVPAKVCKTVDAQKTGDEVRKTDEGQGRKMSKREDA